MTSLPTLADVARMAGVSTATVSRVLNTPDRVREDTRAKVETAVDRLGYAPHFGGRALASNRTGTVGAVIPTMENAIFARALQAMQETLADLGVTLLVATSNYDPDREAHQVRALLGRGVDGLILIGDARPLALYDLLEQRSVPYILAWVWSPDCRRPCIGFDNRAAARAMAERILDLGHRDVAMISGVTAGNDRAAGRVAGMREALNARGLRLPDGALIEAEYTLEAGASATRTLLGRSPRPSAILCGNDVLAAGALLAIRESGLRVPQDISITGFDDIDLARVLDPPLTTVHVPHRRMGRAAASALAEAMESGTEAQPQQFDTTIVERGSLGPA